MRTPHDDITVGRVTLRYIKVYGAWMKPRGGLERNPLRAQRIAEEENSNLK